LKRMLKDRVDVVTKRGEFKDVPASVQRGKIHILKTDIPVEPGDKVIRILPSGVVEEYIVEDPGFYSGMGSIPDSYQMVVRRADPVRHQPIGASVVYNIIGANARFNINSVDNSTNIIDSAPSEMFKALREAIRTRIQDERDRQHLLEKATELENHAGTKGFLASYQRFIALAADHMSVIAPFIPALTQLLPD